MDNRPPNLTTTSQMATMEMQTICNVIWPYIRNRFVNCNMSLKQLSGCGRFGDPCHYSFECCSPLSCVTYSGSGYCDFSSQ